jgi:hypothetical protein
VDESRFIYEAQQIKLYIKPRTFEFSEEAALEGFLYAGTQPPL